MNARSGWIASNTSVDSYFGETQLRIHAIRYYLSTATSVHKLDAIFTYLGWRSHHRTLKTWVDLSNRHRQWLINASYAVKRLGHGIISHLLKMVPS